MGISNIDELTSTYFRYLQRNQLDNLKETLNQLKNTDNRDDILNRSVKLIDQLKLKKSGDTSLHICARNGYLEIIKYLVEEEGASLELINFDGKTCLHDAAQFSQLAVLNYLLSKGCNPNVVKKADWTPLMLACTKDNIEIVQSLVNHGAKLNFVNKDGWTCVHLAAREGHINILLFLLSSSGEIDKLEDKKSKNGRRAIHTAVLHGHLNCVKLLAERVQVKGQENRSNVNEEDTSGSTPLLDACRCGFIEIAEYLINNCGVDPGQLNSNGVGPLHVAAEANQSEMIEFLVGKFKLDVNEPSKLLNFTALHWASREGSLQAIKSLVKLGADLEVKDAKGKTAWTIAQEYGKQEGCQFFEEISTP